MFGDVLRGYRMAAGLTQAELADHAGISVRGLSDLERGARRVPQRETVRRLAHALELPEPALAHLVAAARRAGGPVQRRSTAQPRPTLPASLTSFVGRERELVDVRRSLSEARLVTLTGPGGVGKTRLALEVAGQLARSGAPLYADGIWRVELAPLADGALVPRAVASVLGVQEAPVQPLLESLLGWLHARQLLLVLDNCEHLVAACAAVAGPLLEACPGLTVLATSREALNVAGEVVWPVGPLEPGSDGLQMFAALAALASPAFRLTSDTRSAVIRVCRRLDGLPLAIELAAARVNALTVEEIEQRLDQRFALLTAGYRSSPPRHQTLRALVDWSYELLTDEEQSLLQQLSVFSGGWTLEAAEAICEPAAEVLALLVSLVDKSLVQVELQAGRSRYRLLETVRQYAADKLRELRLEKAARSRHLVWCERLARTGDRGLSGPTHREWLQRLEAEVDNFRAALRWSLLEPADLEGGLRLSASLSRFWFLDCTAGEGSEWLRTLLDCAPASPARIEALSASGFLLVRRGDPVAAHPLLDEAVALARDLGDSCVLAIALNHLGELRVQEGDLAGARAPMEESLALTANGAEWSVYWPSYLLLDNLGELAEAEGDREAASALWMRSVELAGAQQDGFRTVPLRRLGQQAIDRGELAKARDRLTESLVVAREWGKSGWCVPSVLSHLAGLAMAECQPARALRLAGAAIGLRQEHQARLQPTDAARLESAIAPARSALGESVAARAWAEGLTMTLDQAVAYALDRPSVELDASPAATLTPRETEVAVLLGQFTTNREIAARLVISERTAKRHVENILLKLGLRSRAEVAEWARERQLVPVD